jgi:hypothetical protein
VSGNGIHTTDDITELPPVEDVVHFILDCRALHPVRNDFPLTFLGPLAYQGHPRRCISALMSRPDRFLELIDEVCLDEVMPEDYIPVHYDLRRILGFKEEQ